MPSCSPLKVSGRFGGACCLYLHGRGTSQASSQHEAVIKHNTASYKFLVVFIDPEDGDMFLRNLFWLTNRVHGVISLKAEVFWTCYCPHICVCVYDTSSRQINIICNSEFVKFYAGMKREFPPLPFRAPNCGYILIIQIVVTMGPNTLFLKCISFDYIAITVKRVLFVFVFISVM
jgi:hypothetical protein